MTDQVGISGFAVYVPPYRVDLESWCRWTNNVWEKTRAVVGHSFRMRGPAQSVYTMAATAVTRVTRSGADATTTAAAITAAWRVKRSRSAWRTS